MKWELCFTDRPPRVAVFVSKHLHCLYDLLYRKKAGHFSCVVALIVSNHPDAKSIAREFNIPFHVLPITPKKKGYPGIQRDETPGKRKDRSSCPGPISSDPKRALRPSDTASGSSISTIRSCPPLPAKARTSRRTKKASRSSARPATTSPKNSMKAPIIEQDTVRISHRDALNDLVRKGEDLEKAVLSRAVRWHLERKILCYGNKTVIFD